MLSLWLVLFIAGSCYGLQIKFIGEDFVCEVYSPDDVIPDELLEEGRRMYFEAYLHPALHLGISIGELGIDQNLFGSYEEYIDDMFKKDFSSYGQQDNSGVYYFQIRCREDGRVVGVCVVLEKAIPGFYYLDHIGIHWKFRQQGLAGGLVNIVKEHLIDFIEISLDTRVFNLPAQALYEKCGFERLSTHPCAAKQKTYFHYVLLRGL